MIPDFQEFFKTFSPEKIGEMSANSNSSAIVTFENFKGLLPAETQKDAYLLNMFMLILAEYHEWLIENL